MIRRFGRWPFLALLLPVLAAALPARASDEAICERAIVANAAREGVPQAVLHAVSLTETGRPRDGRLRPWPWAINREGQGHWFATREQALAFARASVAAGRTSFDVGCFQINYRWHGHNFPSVEAMFDQDVNAAYAARFLRALYRERGTWSAAAGAYHSQTAALAGVYRARFERILAGLGAAPLLLASGEGAQSGKPDAPRRSRTRLSRGPKIITIAPRPEAADEAPTEEAALPATNASATNDPRRILPLEL